jgi:predicted amidohydrolase YtcJ
MQRLWITSLLIFGVNGAIAAESADLVLFNGKILTVDKSFSEQSVVAVRAGKIIAVGKSSLQSKFRATRSINLHGLTLMPGFIDTHLHLYGRSHRQIEPDKARSITELQGMISAKARQLGPREWITGSGWDEARLNEKRNPTRHDLDEVSPDNPVVLIRAGSHSVVGNSLAFKLAGITAATPEPENGLIERGPDGAPSGVIRERNDLLLKLVPQASFAEMRDSYLDSLHSFVRLGITSFMEARTTLDDEPPDKGGLPAGAPKSVSLSDSHTYREIAALYARDVQGLPRVTLYIDYPGADRLRAFPHHTGYGDDRIKLGPIGETPYDGGFTGPTAYTKEDYKGQPGFRGRTFMTPQQAQEMVSTAESLGWQLGIHAIGDAAIEEMTSIYDRVLAEHPKADHRWFLAHFTMLPSDATMDLLVRDKIYVAAQPNFLYTLKGRYLQTLDGERLLHINPLATALSHHVRMVFGSDNLPIGPLVGLYAAIARKGTDGQVLAGGEAIDRAEAIKLYTIKAAELTWDETKRGSIETGKFADMIALDHNPMTGTPEDILKSRVVLTIIDGQVVYDGRELSGE